MQDNQSGSNAVLNVSIFRENSIDKKQIQNVLGQYFLDKQLR